MKLRPYQALAYDAICAAFETQRRTMVVLPTGGGKTVVFAHLANDWAHGRVMVLAHRDELVRQAAKKLYEVTGEWPAIEMADERSNESQFGRSQFVVASVQSLHPKRLERFQDIGLVIRDEAHRSSEASKTDGRIFQYFEAQNPDCRFLGVTATPNRADRRKTMFDSICYRYTIDDACDDGWLVEPRSLTVVVENLDLSRVRSTKSDLDEHDLAKELEKDAPLHEMADVILRESAGLQTVVFCASVKQAEELTRVMRGYKPGCAEWICGETPKPIRRESLARFDNSEIQYILNVGCLVEGWDSPIVGCLALARPTKSQTLAIQMLGRGTRPLPGIIDDPLYGPEERKLAIAQSAKPFVKVLDFVDVSRQHKLITSVDARLLGGRYSEAEIDAAKQVIESHSGSGEAVEVAQTAKEAKQKLIDEAHAKKLAEARRREEEEREREARYQLGATSYSLHEADLFDPTDSGTMRQSDAPRGKPPTPKQIAYLRSQRIDASRLTRKQCSGIIAKLKAGQYRGPRSLGKQPKAKKQRQQNIAHDVRYKSAPSQAPDSASPAQQRVLSRYQLNPNVSSAEAVRLIGEINARLRGQSGERTPAGAAS